MNLTSAFHAAKQSLGLNSAMAAVTSRNVAGAADPAYTQKEVVWTGSTGGNRLVGVDRNIDFGLQRSVHESMSLSATANEVGHAYARVASILSLEEPMDSISGKLDRLAGSFQTAIVQPENIVSLSEIFLAANDVASWINRAGEMLSEMQVDAERTIRESVGSINLLVDRFHGIQTELLRDRGGGRDITQLLDERDSIIGAISQEIGVSVVKNNDGSYALYASGGAVLYNRVPREVIAVPTLDEVTGASVQSISIDGVIVSSALSPMQTLQGRLAGAIAVRDEIVPRQMRQLDELARSLVASFSEHAAGGSDLSISIPGLFILEGDENADLARGLSRPSAFLAVNPSVDPGSGGSLERIRDGGIGRADDADYNYNPTGAPGFAGRLIELLGSLRSTQTFSPLAGLPNESSVEGYARHILSFAAGKLKASQSGAIQASLTKDRFQGALYGVSGVNLDDEMAHLLIIENNYHASSKLIGVVDRLYDSLFAALR